MWVNQCLLEAPMNRKWISLLLVALGGYALWIWQVDYYDFAILDKSGNESVILRVPKSAVAKYPGWSYERSGPVSFEVWYPSLVDKVSINYWISSSSEIEASKKKPNKNERQLKISIGWGRIKPPEHTLDPANRPSKCGLRKITGEPYLEEGIVEGFKKYVSYDYVKSSENAPPKPRPYNKIYHPSKAIEGVYCLSCALKANCSLIGITSSGIPYTAHYEEERMPKEAIDVHHAVGQYLYSKALN
jgi:hypothetical protein